MWYFFVRGVKLYCQLRWGAMAGFAPLDPPLGLVLESWATASAGVDRLFPLGLALIPDVVVPDCIVFSFYSKCIAVRTQLFTNNIT